MADLRAHHNDIVEKYQMGKSGYTEAEFTVIFGTIRFPMNRT